MAIVDLSRHGRRDFDVLEQSSLERAHLLQANQFQQGKKRDHDFDARGKRAKQIGKTQRPPTTDSLQDKLDLFRNAVALAENLLHTFARFDAFDHRLESVDQLENSNFAEPKRTVQWRRRCFARKDSLLFQLTLMKFGGSVLELFVFDQLADQLPTRVVVVGIFFRRLLVGWEKAATLPVNEVGGHDDKFAGQIDVQFPERLKILEVLVGNPLERDIVDVDLVSLDQIKQEIERPFENLELDLVIAVHASCRNVRVPAPEARHVYRAPDSGGNKLR